MTLRIVTKTIGSNGVLEAGAQRDLPDNLWKEIARQVGIPLSDFTKTPGDMAAEVKVPRGTRPPAEKKQPLKKRTA